MDAPFPPRCRSLFEPVRRLGAGGYGEVRVARQHGLDRQVAVKVLCGEVLTRPDEVERFRARGGTAVTGRLPDLPARIRASIEVVENLRPSPLPEAPGPSILGASNEPTPRRD